VQNAVASSLLQINLSARTTTPKILVVVLPAFPCTEPSVLKRKIAIFFPENNTLLVDNVDSFIFGQNKRMKVFKYAVSLRIGIMHQTPKLLFHPLTKKAINLRLQY
jgi:hypothetical protein